MRPLACRITGALAAVLVGGMLAACAAVLGIDALPVDRDPQANATDATSESSAAADVDGDEVDVVDACPSPTSFCTTFCPPNAFCDDFENVTDPAQRWNSPAGVVNPVLLSDASVELERIDSGNQVLLAHAASVSGNTGAALLVTTLKRPSPPLGVRVSAKLRVRGLDVVPDADEPPLRGVSMIILGHTLSNYGVGIGLLNEDPDEGKLMLFESTLLSKKQTQVMRQTIVSGPIEAFTQNAVPVDLWVAPPAVLSAHGVPCAPQADAEPGALHVAVARINQPQPCVAMPPQLANGDWLAEASILAGAAVEDYAIASVQVDDVALVFLE